MHIFLGIFNKICIFLKNVMWYKNEKWNNYFWLEDFLRLKPRKTEKANIEI